jgi:hypothetical protein
MQLVTFCEHETGGSLGLFFLLRDTAAIVQAGPSTPSDPPSCGASAAENTKAGG